MSSNPVLLSTKDDNVSLDKLTMILKASCTVCNIDRVSNRPSQAEIDFYSFCAFYEICVFFEHNMFIS